jgi:3',5'-cyclic AMP phosphodiesterase CpdA
MFTIAHLSDLRFGAIEAPLLDALERDLETLAPDLIVVSGNLTRRGSAESFAAARGFLDGFGVPNVAVPGPRDSYDLNPVTRFFNPLRRWKAAISSDVAPLFEHQEVVVLGINTSRSALGKRLSAAQASVIRNKLGGREQVTVLVSHNPLVSRPASGTTTAVRMESKDLRVVASCVDVVLAGHETIGSPQDTRVAYRVLDRQSIVAQAGITPSSRGRDTEPYYNAVRIDGDKVSLAVRLWRGAAFEEQGSKTYRYTGAYWDKFTEMPPDFQWSDSSESLGR